MHSTVEQLLDETGPSLSSHLVQMLIKRGLSPEAARKQLSRAAGNVQRLRGLRFPNREAFLFLEGQFGRAEFREHLVAALKTTGSSYGKALIGLTARSGVMPANQLPIASGLPVEKAKGQVPHSFVEQKLIELGLLRLTCSPDGDTISLWDHAVQNERRRATVIVEDITLGMIKAWLIKTGWSSANVLKVRSPKSLPKFGQFLWDLVGPSYLASFRRFRSGAVTNGFIVGDILLDKNVTPEDLRPFFSKWDVLKYQNRATPFQPMFIASWFEPEALMELRAKGCLVIIPKTLFGDDLAQQLHELVGTIEHAAAAITNDPKSVFILISKIAKLEGAALNLRGVVLELFIAHLFKLGGYQIDIRQQITSDDNEHAEIDVKATDRKEVVCIECKAKSPGIQVDAPEIQRWLDKSLVRIKSWLKLSSTLPESRRFEFYTSTDYSDTAKELIAEIQAGHKKQPIQFFTGADVIRKLQEEKESALVDIFREQFTDK